MNDFYNTMKDEILVYCKQLTAENPKVMYLMDVECTVSGEEDSHALTNEENFSLERPMTVRISLILRNRPNPTKRHSITHIWQRGYLVK